MHAEHPGAAAMAVILDWQVPGMGLDHYGMALCARTKHFTHVCTQALDPEMNGYMVGHVYEEIDNLVNNNKAYYIIMGDFNAKIGQGNASKLGTGPYGLGTRDARGDSLINFAVRHQLKIMNTVFKKSPNRRWTWISPNGHTKNEIDFILTSRPHTFTDVSVINSLNTGSDHRMVRGSLTINTKLERARFIQWCKKSNTAVLSPNTTKYQTLLTNRFKALATWTDLNSECENVTSAVTETAMEIAGQNKIEKPEKLSAETKQLREKRRQMKRGGTDVQNIDYVETCKAIRQRMAEEIQSHEERQLQALKKKQRPKVNQEEAVARQKQHCQPQRRGRNTHPRLQQDDTKMWGVLHQALQHQAG